MLTAMLNDQPAVHITRIHPRQRGMALIELMMALGMGVFLLLGLTTFLTVSLKSNNDAVQLANLNQELRTIVTLMTRDIHRAGYWGSTSYSTGALSGIGAGATYVNPFASVNTATAGCILYSYDRNGNGIQDAAEKFGFLLHNGAVMMRTSAGATTYDCTTNAGNALDYLSDQKNIRITALTFSEVASQPVYMAGSSGPNIRIRRINITISGQRLDDTSITQTLTDTVKIENDLFSPS